MVLFDHLQDSLAHRYLWSWSQTGYRGVNVFFVLSGFLITSKLLESADLKKFYVRRFFRLMPVAWTFLGIALLGRLSSVKEVLACVFFIRNFFGRMGIAGHFWSLSIEEQFYLLWPALLLFAGRKRGLWVAGGLALIFGVLHWAMWAHQPARLWWPTWNYADAPLTGCFFALLLADESRRHRLTPLARYCVGPALLGYLCCLFIFPHEKTLLHENILVGICMASTYLVPASAISRIISFSPLAWLGRISYSVYVWQELFMPLGSVVVFLTAMPAVVLISHYGIEKPFNRFGHRIAEGSLRRGAPLAEQPTDQVPV
jgi:peptidoglycan/LPS O-acetylase OafA/YrhL